MKNLFMFLFAFTLVFSACAKRKCNGKRGIKVPMGTLEKKAEPAPH